MRLEVPEKMENAWARVSNFWDGLPLRVRATGLSVAAALILYAAIGAH